MLRKLMLGIIFAMIVSVVAGGFSSQATPRCRRLTITIADTPYFAHPICTDLPVDAGASDVVVTLPGLGL
ncbi:MAG: hypothetical protein ABR548_09920 [Actinomycetota bacterium]|nr:hypothetical protein [Actinomycetota bacterium]